MSSSFPKRRLSLCGLGSTYKKTKWEQSKIVNENSWWLVSKEADTHMGCESLHKFSSRCLSVRFQGIGKLLGWPETFPYVFSIVNCKSPEESFWFTLACCSQDQNFLTPSWHITNLFLVTASNNQGPVVSKLTWSSFQMFIIGYFYQSNLFLISRCAFKISKSNNKEIEFSWTSAHQGIQPSWGNTWHFCYPYFK